MEEIEYRRIRYGGGGRAEEVCKTVEEERWTKVKELSWFGDTSGWEGEDLGLSRPSDLSSDHSLAEQVIVPNRASKYLFFASLI